MSFKLHQLFGHRGRRLRRTNEVQAQITRDAGSFTMVDAKALRADDIVIAIMGPTGSGKSTFIKCASGQDTDGVGDGLRSHTSQVNAIKFLDKISGRHIVLVDTPGFDDTFKSDIDILNLISSWLVSSYNYGKVLSGILYLHRITDNRMAGTPLKNLRLFRKLCGRHALDRVYLTTTMWDEVDPSVGERRLKELKQDYWKTMIDQKAQVALCRSDDDSAKRLLRRIIKESIVEQDEVLERNPSIQLHPQDEDRPPQIHEEVFRTMRGPKLVVKTLDGDPGPRLDDIVIAVVGPTGSGKSAFVCSACGYNTGEVNEGVEPGEKIVTVRFHDEMSGRYVALVEVPDLQNVQYSKFDVRSAIFKWLSSSYHNKKTISAIVHLHPISRYIAPTDFGIYQSLFKKDNMDQLYLTTTMWDTVSPTSGERKMEELKASLWRTLISQGARMARLRPDDDSAKTLVRHIIAEEINSGKVLLIQEEMVELQKALKETAAGQQLYSQLETLVEKQTLLLRRIEKEKRMATDKDILTELQTEYSDLRSQIDDRLNQMQELKLPLLKRLLSRIRD